MGLDLAVLRQASAASRTSRLGGEKDEGLIVTLKEADAAYRGEFMEGFGLEDAPEFDLWVEAQRRAWRARIGEVLDRLGELESETGELAAAAGTAERWVARHPSQEAAHVRLMETRSAAGDPDGALAAYEEYRSELHDIGLDPGPGTETLNASIQTRAEADRTGGGRPAPGSLRMPFVGRETDFGALVEEYRAARSGEVRSVVVVGEAGIGKTRLAEEFLGWAESRGADTLRARTFKAETRLPYETLVDALRPRLERERAPDDLLEDSWLAELSRILPELRNRYPDLPPPTADEASSRALLFEAVARLGAALAGGAPRRRGAEAGGPGEPLVVFVDDLQWADGATLDALSYACRSWARGGVPMILLKAVREEGLRKNNVGDWLSSLERELSVRRLPLAPMDEGNIYILLRRIAGITGPNDNETRREDLERVARWLRYESDGHPLFLAQILGVLLERGVLVEHTGEDGRREVVFSGEGFDEGALRGLIPAGLRDLILVKLRPLSADASNILTAGAVLGRGSGFGELARVAGVGETEGIAALDELVAARLLEEAGAEPGRASGGTYSFTHDKIREVAYTEAGEARREVFHRRALGYLVDLGAPAAELARHAIAAGLRKEAFCRLVEAAEEAMAVFAAGDAVGYYEQARELLEDRSSANAADGDRVPGRLRLYGGLARACALIHDGARAQEAYEKLLAVAREAEDRLAEWEALYGLGTLATGFTHGPDDVELLRGEGPKWRSGPAGGARNEPGLVRLAASHTPRVALGHARKALRLARELDRGDLVLRSEFVLGVACAWASLWKESAAHMEKALSFYAASNNGTTEASVLVHLVGSKSLVALSKGVVEGPDGAFGPTGSICKLFRETTELWGAIDSDYARGQMGAQAVGGLVMAGEYEDAIVKASRGLEASRSLGYPYLAFTSLDGLGEAHREMFALQEARSAYSQMLDWISGPILGGHVHSRLCAVAALMGKWERAHEHALEAIGAGKELFLPLSYLHRHYDIESLLRGGDAELARESLRGFARRVGQGRGYFRVAYLRSAAVLARWNGDTAKTLSHLREAFELAERLELPGEVWQVGASLGETYEERGEMGRSDRAFGRAAVVVRRLSSKIPDGELREGFLAAPQVRRVLEKARDQVAHPDPSIS